MLSLGGDGLTLDACQQFVLYEEQMGETEHDFIRFKVAIIVSWKELLYGNQAKTSKIKHLKSVTFFNEAHY